jgi:hypothetical protein
MRDEARLDPLLVEFREAGFVERGKIKRRQL